MYVDISVENYDIYKNYKVLTFDPIFLPLGNLNIYLNVYYMKLHYTRLFIVTS